MTRFYGRHDLLFKSLSVLRLAALLVLNMVLVYRLLLLEQATYTGLHWDGTTK